MQKIFVGNKPIVLTTKVEKETNFKNLMIDSVDIIRVLQLLKKNKYKSVRLVGSNEDDLLESFLKLLPNVIAGGGKVYNSKGHILFIFRNGKWDLPKGKIEKGEQIKETALREVEEECGISKLILGEFLITTHHIFFHNNKNKLKETHWFEMETKSNEVLIPQLDEGISIAMFKNKKETVKALENSYGNIRLVFEKYYQK